MRVSSDQVYGKVGDSHTVDNKISTESRRRELSPSDYKHSNTDSKGRPSYPSVGCIEGMAPITHWIYCLSVVASDIFQ